MFKFNGGDGAIICDRCRRIIKTPATIDESTEPDKCERCQTGQNSGQRRKEMIKVVEIDVDAVLRDFVGQLEVVFKLEHPDHIPGRVNTWDLVPFFSIGKGIYSYFNDAHPKECFEDAPAFDGASEFIRGLREAGFKVCITTTQKIGNEIYTLNWLKKNGIQYDAIVFTSNKELTATDILLDDGIHNLEKAESVGKIAVCFDQPWNQEWEGRRAKSFSDFLTIVSEVNNESGN